MNPDSKIAGKGIARKHRAQQHCHRLPLLRPFTPKELFPVNEGFEDRLELQFGKWDVETADESDWIDFKNHLQGPAEGEEHTAFKSGTKPPKQSKLFLRSQSKGQQKNRLNIRKHSLFWKDGKKRAFPPLFDGWLSFRRGGFDPNGRLHHSLTCKLILNLQRFIRHQPDDPSASFAVRRFNPKGAWLKRGVEDRTEHHDEFSYDANDNWVPNTLKWRAFARPGSNELHLRNYIEAVRKSVYRDLHRALVTSSGDDTMLHPRVPYHAFTRIETGWEFASDNPVDEVVFYGERFMNLSKRAGRAAINRVPKNACRAKVKRVANRTRELNSPRYEFPLKGGVLLRLYAKTNQRIRFEVVFMKLKNFRADWLRDLGIEPHPPDEKGEVNFRPDFELYATITAARKHASRQLREFLGKYRECYGTSARPFSAFEFLSAVTAATPPALSEQKRSAMLCVLVPKLILHQGWFARVPNAMRATFQRLTPHVLTWDKSSQCYRIGPQYRAAVNALRKITGETALALVGTRRGVKPIRER